MEFESQEDGFMAKIVVPDGTNDIPAGGRQKSLIHTTTNHTHAPRLDFVLICFLKALFATNEKNTCFSLFFLTSQALS